jgi:ketosteroid isomerase-like protein
VKAFYAANRISNMTAEPVEIEIAGDWAYTREHFTATLTPSDGGSAILLDAKEIDIWRRGPDGEWRVSRAIFDSNTPPGSHTAG